MTGPAPTVVEPALYPGARVSHYEIRGLLGRGGMGVVYRAVDLSLDREVAIKCVRADRAEDPDYRRRLLREARAASRLSHPNIVRVLDVLEVDGLPAIVMELVDGECLHARLERTGPLPLDELLAVAEDVTKALQVAHAEGILHRDITPNNVFLARGGHTLLMDFGLAKRLGTGEGGTASLVTTESTPGAVLGTPGYMAPEQLLGRPVDRRTDIFSLGVVLYEMCTGARAFPASSSGDFIDATLHREPQAIARLNYAVPQELERIVRKALAKRPDERYQDARELQADLRALRRRSSGETAIVATGSQPRRRFIVTAAVWAGLLLAATAWLLLRNGGPEPLPLASPRQLTSGPALETDPAISPDGSFVAFASNETGDFEVYLADVATGQTLRLTADPGEDREPAWFPDGSALAFVSDRGGTRSIWRVSRLGGSATMLVPDATDPAVSPDGIRVAFARPATGDGRRVIWTAPLVSPAAATRLSVTARGLWSHRHPAWSPDGATLCFSDYEGLWLVRTDGSELRRASRQPAYEWSPAFGPDGRYVYCSSRRGRVRELWRIAMAGGEAQRITLGTGTEDLPSVSASGKRLAYASRATESTGLLVDLASGRRTALPAPLDANDFSLSADGTTLVFLATVMGRHDAWRIALEDGVPRGDARRITEVGDIGTLAVSADGRFVAFHRIVAGQRDIWVCPTDGGVPVNVTETEAAELQPAWSPDGAWLAFVSDRDGGYDVWAAPMRAGSPAGPARRITDGTVMCGFPEWSPDGTRIAFMGGDGAASEGWVVAADGTAPARPLTTGARALAISWEGEASLLVSGLWGRAAEVRRVGLTGGAAASLVPPLILGEEDVDGQITACPGRGLLACGVEKASGHVWVLEAERGTY